MNHEIDHASCLPPGWIHLFNELLDELKRLDPEIRALQAKEKFGELRVYLERYTPGTRELIEAASDKSRHTCQECGSPGRLRQKEGFFATLCDDHGRGFKIVSQDPIAATFSVTGRKMDRSKRL